MKNKKEQIRKVADALSYECQQSKTCDGCFARGRVCSDYKTAEKLYKAGYRKASDVIDEFVERIIQRVTENNTDEGYLDESIDYTCLMDDIKELAAEMRQEVEK